MGSEVTTLAEEAFVDAGASTSIASSAAVPDAVVPEARCVLTTVWRVSMISASVKSNTESNARSMDV